MNNIIISTLINSTVIMIIMSIIILTILWQCTDKHERSRYPFQVTIPASVINCSGSVHICTFPNPNILSCHQQMPHRISHHISPQLPPIPPSSPVPPVPYLVQILCTSVYLTTALFGYLLFGEDTASDVLANFDSALGPSKVSDSVHMLSFTRSNEG